jgi:hypothetical protein
MNTPKPFRAVRDSRKLFLAYFATFLGLGMAYFLSATFGEWMAYELGVVVIYTGGNVAQRFSPTYVPYDHSQDYYQDTGRRETDHYEEGVGENQLK